MAVVAQILLFLYNNKSQAAICLTFQNMADVHIGQDYFNMCRNKKFQRNFKKSQTVPEKLTRDLGAGFTRVNLFYMRRFYLAFQKVHTLCEQLSWRHRVFRAKT